MMIVKESKGKGRLTDVFWGLYVGGRMAGHPAKLEAENNNIRTIAATPQA